MCTGRGSHGNSSPWQRGLAPPAWVTRACPSVLSACHRAACGGLCPAPLSSGSASLPPEHWAGHWGGQRRNNVGLELAALASPHSWQTHCTPTMTHTCLYTSRCASTAQCTHSPLLSSPRALCARVYRPIFSLRAWAHSCTLKRAPGTSEQGAGRQAPAPTHTCAHTHVLPALCAHLVLSTSWMVSGSCALLVSGNRRAVQAASRAMPP